MVKAMSIRSERIKSLIENSGKTYQELEKVTGIKKSSLQRYASGTTPKIPLDVIERLSVFFNVSKEYLMGWEDENTRLTHSMEAHSVAQAVNLQLFAEKPSPDPIKLTEAEQLLLDLFRQIPEEKQELFLQMGRLYADSLKID
jgi:transcriptional regulator with XRE-family HTH domain